MLNPGKTESCAIIVLGTYGSGSSAVAGILHKLGVMMGTKLVPPSEANPRGHYEDIHFRKMLYDYRTDRSILVRMLSFIDARYQHFDLWGVKEPAIIEAIMDIAPGFAERKHKVIVTDRDSMACARSYKRKWPDSDIDKTHTHIINILAQRDRYLDEYRPETLHIDYNSLTDDPVSNVNELIAFVFGDKPNIFESRPYPADEQIEDAIRHVDPDMNHRWEAD